MTLFACARICGGIYDEKDAETGDYKRKSCNFPLVTAEIHWYSVLI
jgi:hypothetical protein